MLKALWAYTKILIIIFAINLTELTKKIFSFTSFFPLFRKDLPKRLLDFWSCSRHLLKRLKEVEHKVCMSSFVFIKEIFFNFFGRNSLAKIYKYDMKISPVNYLGDNLSISVTTKVLNIYDKAFLHKQLTAKSCWLFSQESSIVDARMGSKICHCKESIMK